MSVAAAEFDRAISRPRQLEIDPLLTFAVATLLLLGVVMVASASMSVAEREFGSAFFYLQRHAAHLVVGLLLGLVVLGIPSEWWRAGSPFALMFAVIPIESFVSSSRTVLGIVVAAVLRFFAFLLRLIGNAGYFTARLIVNIYDLLIFPSIWLEGVIVGSKTKNSDTSEEQPYKDITITEEAIDKINDPIDYTEQHGSK